MKHYIGIDLGGTNIACGLVNENGEIVNKLSIPTRMPRSAEEIMDDMCEGAKRVSEKYGIKFEDVDYIGIGSPGTCDRERGVVLFSNNLAWTDVHIKDYMEKKLGKKVDIENDANAAALGEYFFGAGKGVSDMVAITLGTGVGSGIIVGGKIIGGYKYAGGEIGHTVIAAGGRKCTCGRIGCFEAYCSATGLIAMTKEKMLKNKSSRLWEIAKSLDKVSGRTPFTAAKLGDESGKEIIADYLYYLSIGLGNVINIFQPQVICLGGGVANEGENLLAPLRPLVQSETYDVTNLTQILSAQLSNDAGIIGAAFLWKQGE